MKLDTNAEWVQLDVAARPGSPLRAAVPGQNRPADQFLPRLDQGVHCRPGVGRRGVVAAGLPRPALIGARPRAAATRLTAVRTVVPRSVRDMRSLPERTGVHLPPRIGPWLRQRTRK